MKRVLPYLFAGMLFGFVLVKAEAVSWFRIQEMFHFQSFHMFGILFSAVFTAFLSIRIIRHLVGKPSLVERTPIEIPTKNAGRLSYPIGGLIFGIGWGIIGLCPGPIFAMIGTGSLGALIVLVGALHGTWLYGVFEKHLPR